MIFLSYNTETINRSVDNDNINHHYELVPNFGIIISPRQPFVLAQPKTQPRSSFWPRLKSSS